MLGNARIPLQIDVGFGDAVTPAPEYVKFPTLLAFPAPHVRAYPMTTVVAEKLEAIVKLGIANSTDRIKIADLQPPATGPANERSQDSRGYYSKIPGHFLYYILISRLSRSPMAMPLPMLSLLPLFFLQSLVDPGVSRELATYRAERISNVRYNLHLDITARDSAIGHVSIRFDRRGKGDVILDFRGQHLANATVNGTSLKAYTNNGAHISVPASAVRDGANTLEFNFVTPIAASGASIIRFHDTSDDTDYLYTLLVPADANQLFPCFDQPDLKARVTLELTTSRAWTSIANGSMAHADTAEHTVRVRFAETKPISTYLIGFAAGPWGQVTRTVGNRTITMSARASRLKEVEADSLIMANARATEWLEEYFGVPFPFEKIDFVLAPAFPFGGMEHPGAIFYNEDRFVFRERPTMPQLLNREATIYHEIAHQWFGDFVTMRWFDDLWLKEGFATYMAAKMQAALSPASDAWKTFYLRNKPAAYDVDQTAGTVSVWQPLANLDQAKSNYGPIVYNKAPGILKQLNYVVDDSAFRAGLHLFLTRHAYANATWKDLLEAIGTVANTSLRGWGDQYILRPGMPVIEQLVTTRNGEITSLSLRQSAANVLSGKGIWLVRTEVVFWYASGHSRTTIVDMTKGKVKVDLPAGMDKNPVFAFANVNDYAYAQLALDSTSVAWLQHNVGTLSDALLRAMAWDALWNRVRDAQFSPSEYITLAMRELPQEQDEQITASILAHTVRAANAYLSTAQRNAVAPNLESTLKRVTTDTSRSYGIRKTHLDAFIAIAHTPPALTYLDALLDSSSAAGAPLRAPTRWAIITTLLGDSAPTAELRLANEQRSDSTSDGKRRAFIAEAARPTAETKRTYFAHYLADSTLNEDWATASLSVFNSLGASTLTLPYVRPALDSLPWVQKNRRIFFLGSWLTAFLNGQTSQEAAAIVKDYLASHPRLGTDLRQKVLQASDELDRTVAIRRAFASEVP